MECRIRTAREADMTGVHTLIAELAAFEKEPKAVEVTVADLRRAGFEEHRFHCFVAEMADRLVGMALLYPRYSTWKGPVIHLEDLIVTETMRGQGIGKALLTEVVRYGSERGVRRISWEVLDWNAPAIDFYETNGARVLRDWDVVQLDEKGIETFLATIG